MGSDSRSSGLELDDDENDQCRRVKRKLSLLSQKLRILINVCSVYATRLSRAMARRARSEGHVGDVIDEEEDEGLREGEERMLRGGAVSSPVLPRLSNEVRNNFGSVVM